MSDEKKYLENRPPYYDVKDGVHAIQGVWKKNSLLVM